MHDVLAAAVCDAEGSHGQLPAESWACSACCVRCVQVAIDTPAVMGRCFAACMLLLKPAPVGLKMFQHLVSAHEEVPVHANRLSLPAWLRVAKSGVHSSAANFAVASIPSELTV